MNEYLMYASYGLGIVLTITSSVIYKKWRIWKIVLLILLGGLYGVYLYNPGWLSFIDTTQFIDYFGYVLYASVILIALNFTSKVRITQNLTDYDFFEMENNTFFSENSDFIQCFPE